MIPQKIFYIWFGKKQLSSQTKENLITWQKCNPDYEIIKIDETNFDINKYPFIRDAYNSKNWAFASDMARLIVIYQNGGFYFDTDVKIIKSLDPLTKYKSVWGMEMPGLINSGLIIGAKKEDDDLKNLINIYQNKVFDSKNINAMLTPRIISDYFKNKGLTEKNTIQRLKNDTVIFPTDYFAPYHWWGGGNLSHNTVAIQQYQKGWGKEDISKATRLIARIHYNFPKSYSKLRLFLKKFK